MLAQGAVSAIRSGCQMLSEGKAEIDKFKKTVEQGVGDAKAIYGQVTGLWSWLLGLFGVQQKHDAPKVDVQAPKAEAKPVAKKANRQPQPQLSYEEYQARAIHEVCEHLKVFFDIQRQLKEHCRELEEQSKTTDKVADAAIDRIEIETQLISLSKQIREAMTYTPQELGLQDLYKRFLQMYEQILEEQEFDRQVKLKKARDEAWRLEHRKEILTYKLVYAVAVIAAALEMIGLYLTL
jgi:hypothetical protein